MGKRIEPARAPRDFDERIDGGVPRTTMPVFVCENQESLLVGKSRSKISGQNEPGSKDADECRAGSGIGTESTCADCGS